MLSLKFDGLLLDVAIFLVDWSAPVLWSQWTDGNTRHCRRHKSLVIPGLIPSVGRLGPESSNCNIPTQFLWQNALVKGGMWSVYVMFAMQCSTIIASFAVSCPHSRKSAVSVSVCVGFFIILSRRV